MTVKEFLESFEVYFSGMFESKGEKFDEAMHYACFGGGKRVRPTAVFLGASAISDRFPEGAVMSLAAALELIHSYSLVHDDLPAMDNDDLRRGQPTVHKKFGEATAILVGDALLSSSSTVLINAARVFGDDFLSAASVVTRASENMVRGQVMDIAGMKTAEQFKTMYSLKTGALITAAFQAGAIVAIKRRTRVPTCGRYTGRRQGQKLDSFRNRSRRRAQTDSGMHGACKRKRENFAQWRNPRKICRRFAGTQKIVVL